MSDEHVEPMIQDQLKDGTLTDGALVNKLLELTNCTETGSKQVNASDLVHEELDIQRGQMQQEYEHTLLGIQEVEVAKDEAIKKGKQLFVQEEMAVGKLEPNETKETMQASQSLAHDIRTLLTEILSLAKILSNSDLDQKQRQLLDAMMSYGESAFRLMNDNVDRSKIKLGMDMESLASMWPEDLDEVGRKFKVEKPGSYQHMFGNTEDALKVDFKWLYELTSSSEIGSIQLNNLVKEWERKQNNAIRLLNEERAILTKKRQEIELKKFDIQEEHRFDEASLGDKRPVSILEEDYDIWEAAPQRRLGAVIQEKPVEVDAEFDTVKYWKLKAEQLEQALEEKLQENIKLLETQASPIEELSQELKRADNFLHFVLQNAPIVIGHQDNELRYRFIYNHFPSLGEEDIIGKTDLEIFAGSGIKELHDFKKEVMERARPAKREITFGTELFGTKIFLIHAEPVFNNSGNAIGVNYLGMDITDQKKHLKGACRGRI